MKTISQALIDEVLYPIPLGYVENVCIKRDIDGEGEFSSTIANSDQYKGAMADCLRSLIQAVNFAESDKSVGTLTDKQRDQIIKRANALYSELGEPLIEEEKPMVFIGG